MKLSVVLPVHNSEGTLEECLAAILNSEYKNFEVILVDDRSTDGSMKIAEIFPVKRIKLGERKGAAAARNKGIEEASGEAVLFVDSDVILKKDSLSLIAHDLESDKEISGVSGVYSKESRFKNFFSQYKHLVWRYRLIVGDAQDDSFTTAFSAVRKSVIGSNRFDESVGRATIEDIEFGRRLIAKGNRFVLDKNIEVEHIKRFTTAAFCRNQFLRSKDIIKAWLCERAYVFYLAPSRKNTFAKRYLLRVPIAFALCISLAALFITRNAAFAVATLAVLFSGFLAEIDFLKFCFREKGAIFTLGCAVAYYLDGIASGAGVMVGGLEFLLKRIAR